MGSVVARTVDGRDMEREQPLMQTLDRVLGFPEYFGSNWDALDECLADREFEPRTPTVIVIHGAEMVLQRAPKDNRRVFANILNRISGGKAASNYANIPDSFPSLWVVIAFSNQAAMEAFSRLTPDAIICHDL